MTRRLVLVESPFTAENADDFERNLRYLKAIQIDCMNRNETPFAGHFYYPALLHDADQAERQLGMEMSFQIGFAFAAVRGAIVEGLLPEALPEPLQVFYTDLGISHGMRLGGAEFDGVLEREERQLGPDWEQLLEGRETIRHIALPDNPVKAAVQAAMNAAPNDAALGRAIRKIMSA